MDGCGLQRRQLAPGSRDLVDCPRESMWSTGRLVQKEATCSAQFTPQTAGCWLSKIAVIPLAQRRSRGHRRRSRRRCGLAGAMTPLSWPVVPDKPQPALGGIPHVRAIKRGVPGARRAVVAPDRSSQCVSPCLKGSPGEAVHEAVKSIQASLEGGPKQTTRRDPDQRSLTIASRANRNDDG